MQYSSEHNNIMHPKSAFLLIVVAVSTAAMVHGHLGASTPAARFWEQALSGSPMPEVLADFVQKGIDQSPLVGHYSVPPVSISMCTLFNTMCDARTVAETGIFFREDQLHPGSTMTLSFPAEAETPILPHDVAGKVPFENLGDVLATFHISPGSAEAAQVEDTLRKCKEPPIAGEMKACTTSLENTVKAAMEMLGITTIQQGGGDVWAATSALPRRGLLPRREYVVEAVTKLEGSGYVACHKVPFPYAVYHCHIAYESYRGYKVTLRGRGDDDESPAVSLLAFCHFDTSCWNPAHPAFQILKTHPGAHTSVCHFMSYGNLAFVKKAGTA